MHAVILAGGKGVRLRPYTTALPKPLVPIGDSHAILEIVLHQLVGLRVHGRSRWRSTISASSSAPSSATVLAGTWRSTTSRRRFRCRRSGRCSACATGCLSTSW